MRAVLDTNVLLSGLFWRGAPYECLLAAEAGLYELILANEILEELRDKLVTKFGRRSISYLVEAANGAEFRLRFPISGRRK